MTARVGILNVCCCSNSHDDVAPKKSKRRTIPMGIWCQKHVVSTSMRRYHFTSTLIRPHPMPRACSDPCTTWHCVGPLDSFFYFGFQQIHYSLLYRNWTQPVFPTVLWTYYVITYMGWGISSCSFLCNINVTELVHNMLITPINTYFVLLLNYF